MSTAVIWSKSKPNVEFPIWRTFGRIQWRVIPEPHATLQGVRIPSAIMKIVFRHILFFFVFNAVWALTSGGFRIVSDTLVVYPVKQFSIVARNTNGKVDRCISAISHITII